MKEARTIQQRRYRVARGRSIVRARMAIISVILMGSGCGGNGVQSVLNPGGPAARDIADLWWILFALGTAVFVVVIAMTLFAALGRRSRSGPPFGERGFLLAAGIGFPFVILFVVLFLSLKSTFDIRMPDSELTVELVGHQFWWEVRYPEDDIVIANEIYIPAGRPVHLRLHAADVIHSFWVPALHGKIDLIPGKMNQFWIEADSAGLYRGQCAEFCGEQHANMGLWVRALDPMEFDRWLDRRRSPAAIPETDAERRGLVAFTENGCDACHAIAGTAAMGAAGPALTDIGSRLTLGAATIGNSRENLAHFIRAAQEVKPGNLMPDQNLAPDEMDALVSYLASLR